MKIADVELPSNEVALGCSHWASLVGDRDAVNGCAAELERIVRSFYVVGILSMVSTSLTPESVPNASVRYEIV